jgi:hypothetical protein
MLHVDVPTLSEIRDIIGQRADACISIYVPTTPQTQHVGASKLALKNLAKNALDQLERGGLDKRRRTRIEDEFDALADDDDFWAVQANSLAVLATPDNMRTYRLATAVKETVEVSDRFHVNPLLRAIAFPQHAYVLALSEGAVRLVEIFADAAPVHVRVPNLPKNASDAVNRASINNLTQNTRISNAQGQTVLFRQFARAVDSALRPWLAGRDTPLILASTDPMAPVFRGVCTYPALLSQGIQTSPDRMTDGELAEAARKVLDGHYAAQVASARQLFEKRSNELRSTQDISQAARAATMGAIELLLVDMDDVTAGTISEDEGKVEFAAAADSTNYSLVDEIAARAINSGAKVLAVRKSDIPDGKSLAAVLRYAV